MDLAARELLHEARPIRVDPEQVEALPDWEDWDELAEYGRTALLPFPIVFLDLVGLDGEPTRVAPPRGFH